MGDDIQIHVVSSTVVPKSTFSNFENNKKGKRKYNSDNEKDSEKETKSQKQKTKRIKSEITKPDRSQKFSSLFRNNPEIPQREKLEVETVKEDVFSSNQFSDLGLHHHLVKGLKKRLNAITLTSVQRKSIPHVLQGKDVLVKSQTGSGKTLCYAVPIVEKLQSASPKVSRQDGPYAMIISPTRELTLQSYETIEKLTQSFVWVVPGLIMGGEKKSKEKARLRKGLNIVLGTPGRILDHLYNTQSLAVDRIKYLVIDEADRMLDMGFEDEISKIVSVLKERCPNHMQTILLSATLTAGIEKLAGISLEDPVRIDVADSTNSMKKRKDNITETNSIKDLNFTTPEGLKHHFVVVPSKLRLVSLAAFILWKAKYSSKQKKLIVFLATQSSVEFHHKVLSYVLSGQDESSKSSSSGDVQLFSLHGDLAQKERTRVYHEFTKVSSGVLLCTDVAARGLNLENVRWIVQYNTPGKPTDYIHRVGRTARIGSQGHALIFLSPSEVEYLKVLQNINVSLKEMKVDDILKTLLVDVQKWANFERSKPNTAQECATAIQVGIEKFIHDRKEMRTLARKAYQSYIRAYAVYPRSMKHIFHIKHLHLGHVAKSFGLQEAPKHIADVVSNNIVTGGKRKFKEKKTKTSSESYLPKKKARLDLISEFSSGFVDKEEATNRRNNKIVKVNKKQQKSPKNYQKKKG